MRQPGEGRWAGRPKIRKKLWDEVVKVAKEEGMLPSEVVEDAIENFLFEKRG